MKISIIAAMGKNRVIGKDNQLMWRLPQELQYFKQTTMGHHLVMGRKTFQAYPKALPGRTSIIVTRQEFFDVPSGCLIKHSLEDAFAYAKTQGEQECFIIGGAEIYTQTIDSVDHIYLTYVDFCEEGHAYFPQFDEARFHVETLKTQTKDELNPYAWIAKRFDRAQT